MIGQLDKWRFINESRGGENQLRSISEGVELLVKASRKEMGESICFQHFQKGAICSTTGREFATLSFNPHYDEHAHSLYGFHKAVPTERAQLENFYFVDNTETVSSIEVGELLPILDVVRAVIFILEYHEYPTFLKWRSGC